MLLAQKLYQTLDFEPVERFEENLPNTVTKGNDTVARLINRSALVLINDVENISDPTIIHEKINSATLTDDTNQRIFIHNFPDPNYRKKEKELQWWLGKVVEIKKNSFIGKLEDLEGRLNIVEFNKNIVPEMERQNIELDDRFTYCIKSRESFSGGLDHFSNLSFFKRRSWKPEYEDQVEETMNAILPPDFLNI
ncbi:MAG: hypothetical protein NDI81_15790 [Desulfobacula sp.]|nr:hypothetical protein [Desulfobacula sp.]